MFSSTRFTPGHGTHSGASRCSACCSGPSSSASSPTWSSASCRRSTSTRRSSARVNKIAESQPPTVAEVRAAFDRQKEVEYSISSVTSKDLQITKENDRVVISFAYDKEVPIYGPVYILIKYEGRSK